MTDVLFDDDTWRRTFDTFATDWHAVSRPVLPSDWNERYREAADVQEALMSQGRWLGGPASLLGALGIRHLETVHSTALAWFLDPSGRHGLGSFVLERFLRRLGLPAERALDRVQVITEESCEHPELERFGYVDIVLRAADWVIAIENKVWAGQHGDQLDLYYDAYQPIGAVLVYLTPDGVPAESARPEVRDAYKRLSWRRAVIPDLRDAIEQGSARGGASTAAVEYLRALEEEFR